VKGAEDDVVEKESIAPYTSRRRRLGRRGPDERHRRHWKGNGRQNDPGDTMQSRDVDVGNDGGYRQNISISCRRAVVDMFCAAEQMEKEMLTSLKMASV